jgi:hypothetical protein
VNRTTTAPVLLSVALALLAAGCSSISSLPPAAVPACDAALCCPDAASTARVLSSALPGDMRKAFLGVRTGVFVPVLEGQEDYEASMALGLFYPGKLPGFFGVETVAFEAGLDFGWFQSDTREVNASLTILRFDCAFADWDGDGTEAEFFVVGGLHLLFVANDVSGHADEQENGMAINGGVGLAWPHSGLDVRATASIILGTTNVGSIMGLTAAYIF